MVSDGVNIQELSAGVDAQVLGMSGGAPTWITNSSNPLVKVSKTFSDIDLDTLTMDLYTLPEDTALVNVWTDITTIFDLSTGVTIGDGADDNGFAETTDWTAGTGLTDATRGVYVTTFQTMRSTSGTTAIKAYNFTATGSTFLQNLTNNDRQLGPTARQELAQQFNAGHVLVGENISTASWWFNNAGSSPTGTIRAFIRQSDGTLIATSSTALDASTTSAGFVKFTFVFPNTTLSAGDMITLSAADMTGGAIDNNIQDTEMTNGMLFETTSTGSSYVQMVAKQMRMEVTYAAATDTQGAVDFYLQVVD